ELLELRLHVRRHFLTLFMGGHRTLEDLLVILSFGHDKRPAPWAGGERIGALAFDDRLGSWARRSGHKDAARVGVHLPSWACTLPTNLTPLRMLLHLTQHVFQCGMYFSFLACLGNFHLAFSQFRGEHGRLGFTDDGQLYFIAGFVGADED